MNKFNLLFIVSTFSALMLLIALMLLMMWPGLRQPTLEGLDGAHHLMDGLFFYDLLRDQPWTRVVDYTFEYYRRYPALGFIFWPPFFPLVEGLFFHVLGMQMQSALMTYFLFGVVLILSFGWLIRPILVNTRWTWLATALLITASVLLPYWNTVMREIPVLAMMMLWLVCWRRWLDQPTGKAMLYVVVVGWLVIYTKQTGALIFFVAAIEILLLRRVCLRNTSLWYGLILFIVGALPLLAWTLTYGQANLSQSIGTNTQSIMADYQGASRWSLAAWGFYLPVLINMLPKLLVLGLLFSAVNLQNKSYWFWWLWLICFYGLFSYFDNRDARFAILVLPPLLVLSVAGWREIEQRIPFLRWPLTLMLSVVLGQQVVLAMDYVPRGERGLAQIVSDLHQKNAEGNIVYIGKYRQLWVYHQRMSDSLRSRAILQGEDLLALTNSWPTLLRDYQVAYVVIEQPENPQLPTQLADVAKRAADVRFTVDDHEVVLQVWQYLGEKANVMAEIPLKSQLIQ